MNDEEKRAVAFFVEAVKHPIEDRAAFLDRVCDGNKGLRRKMEALLRAHDQVGNCLKQPRTK